MKTTTRFVESQRLKKKEKKWIAFYNLIIIIEMEDLNFNVFIENTKTNTYRVTKFFTIISLELL